MKTKLMMMAIACVMMMACQGNSQNAKEEGFDLQHLVDSLQMASEQKDTEINEMLSTLNDIEQGFRQINEAQGRVVVERTGEGARSADRIKSDMQFIQQTLAENTELINKLRQRVSSTSIRSEQLAKTINNLTEQLQEKATELETLRQELEERNIHIAELDEQVVELGRDINELRDDNVQKDQTINHQDQQLNMAWFVYGTKNELKEHNILKDGKVLQQSFDNAYFTQIDIRQVTSIPLYSRDAKVLTSHPQASYVLERDADRQYVLKITNAQLFWSTSKYLVIQVK